MHVEYHPDIDTVNIQVTDGDLHQSWELSAERAAELWLALWEELPDEPRAEVAEKQ